MRQPTECKIIAEIGATHLGDMERAKTLIRDARLCGADYVKLQKRNPDESTPEHMKDKPHPNERFAYGSTYLEHRWNLELDIAHHAELLRYCNEIGIGYSTSVWDMTSAREVVALKPDFIKVPSACNLHYEMLSYLFNEYEGGIHLSTGMTERSELEDLYRFIASENPGGDRVVLYHCTSAYPCPFENLYLNQISNLVVDRVTFNLQAMQLGFSNHGYGIAADVAAYMLGADWVERHFIDDRTIRHTDASASLEPDGLRRLCRDLGAVRRALQFRPFEMDDLEKEQRHKLKFIPKDNK